MAYIEERVEKLTDAINDMKVAFSNRLTAIETEQRGIKEQLTRMNGSVGKTIERVGALETKSQTTCDDVATLKKSSEKHESWISKTKLDAAFTKGKYAGVCMVSSAAGSLIVLAFQWYLRNRH